MRLLNSGLFAALLLASGSVAMAKPLSAELKAQMTANLARGDLLYGYDQTAWHTTDAMQVAVSAELMKVMRGYIITPDGENLRATYYGGEPGKEFVVYAATWDGNAIIRPVLYGTEPRPQVSAEERRLIAARQIALGNGVIDKLGFCSEAMPNITVIPGATAADLISIYLMTPQKDHGVWPLGGHNRVDVKDGKIVGQRAFTKSCISLGGGVKKGEKLQMMSITHILDPVPTEIHAFTVHTSETALQVITDDSDFVLHRTNGKIVVAQDR
ncbi:MAG: hypothetical protein V4696_11915 [Pseudomonadota bacterium]